MKSVILNTFTTALFVGLASTSFANDAQPELQPASLEIGWFKRPVDMTSYLPSFSNAGVPFQDYRFLTDFSPQ